MFSKDGFAYETGVFAEGFKLDFERSVLRTRKSHCFRISCLH